MGDKMEKFTANSDNQIKQCLKCAQRYEIQLINCPNCQSNTFIVLPESLPKDIIVGISLNYKVEKFNEDKSKRIYLRKYKTKKLVKDNDAPTGYVNKTFYVDDINMGGEKMISELVEDSFDGTKIVDYEHSVKEHPTNRGSAKINNKKRGI